MGLGDFGSSSGGSSNSSGSKSGGLGSFGSGGGSSSKKSSGGVLGAVSRKIPKPVKKGVGAALDIIGRPGQAVLSGIAASIDNPFKVGGAQNAAFEGLSGKTNDTGVSIIQQLTGGKRDAVTGGATGGYQLKGAAGFATNLGAGIVTDPATYVTFGTSGLAKTGLKAVETTLGAEKAALVAAKGTKALSKTDRSLLAEATTPTLMKALDKGAQGGVKFAGRTVVPGKPFKDAAKATGLTKAADTVKHSAPAKFAADVFSPRAATKREFGQAVAQKVDDARVRFHSGVNALTEEDLVGLSHLNKMIKPTSEELATVGRALDLGGTADMVPERLRPLYDHLDMLRSKLETEQVDGGVPLNSSIATEDYYPRYLTKDGEKFFKKETSPLRTGASPFRADSGNLKQREFRPDESAFDIATPDGKAVFNQNPLQAFAQRAAEVHRDVGKRRFVEDLKAIKTDDGKDLFIEVADDIAGPLKTHPDFTEINVPGVGRFVAHKAIAKDVKHQIALFSGDETTTALLRFADKWMALWKGYATVGLGPLSGGYFLRNGLTNLAMIDIAGGASLGDFRRAQRLQRALAQGRKEGDVFAALSGADRTLIEKARQLDVLGSSRANYETMGLDPFEAAKAGDSLGNPSRLARTGRRLNPVSQDNALFASGRAVNNLIEDNARLALFISMYRKTGSYEEAARIVRKYLFDYSDLTATEQKVFKRFRGFYTWSRKNLPIQVEALLTQPGKISRYEHLRDALESQAPGIEDTPDYLVQNGAVPLPQSISDILAAIPGSGFDKGVPAMWDLSNVIPFAAAVQEVRPFAQLAGEVPGLNRIPGIEKNENGYTDTLAQILSQNLAGGAPGAVSSIAQAALGKKFFSGATVSDKKDDTPYLLRPLYGDKISGTGKFLWEENAPLLGKVNSVLPADEYGKEIAGRRRLSSATGLSVYPVGPAQQKQERKRQKELRNKKRDARD